MLLLIILKKISNMMLRKFFFLFSSYLVYLSFFYMKYLMIQRLRLLIVLWCLFLLVVKLFSLNIISLLGIGKVLLFSCSCYSPWRYMMPIVYWLLEPLAFTVWNHQITELGDPELVKKFKWRKELRFMGLYQKLVGVRVED